MTGFVSGLSLILFWPPAHAALSVPQRPPWIELSAGLDAFRDPTGQWLVVGQVREDPKNPRRLAWESGRGVLVNGPAGRTNNLVTRQSFGDLQLHLEFMIPHGSNSGVKFEGVYEIQILDSWQAKKLSGNECGGIYPRAEEKPRYHHIDDGVAPTTNAARPPGQWQTLDVVFQAPRFDSEGNKLANARFVQVLLGGELIHENVEVPTPTGHVWREREFPTGPLLLQADHGPVAFRNVRVRRWVAGDGTGED